MKRDKKVAVIKKKAPRGFVFPKSFDLFIEMLSNSKAKDVWYSVSWRNPCDYGLEKEVAEKFLPFLDLPDGGMIAFWLVDSKSRPVVYVSSEGECKAVGKTFDEFLARITAKKTGVQDIDESTRIDFKSKAKIENIGTLTKKFKAWFEEATAGHEVEPSGSSEEIRMKIVEAARTWIAEDTKQEYDNEDDFKLDFRATRKGDKVVIEYFFRGWKKISEEYGFSEPVRALFPMIKHPKLDTIDFSAWSDGYVSVNKGNELTLEPPVEQTLVRKCFVKGDMFEDYFYSCEEKSLLTIRRGVLDADGTKTYRAYRVKKTEEKIFTSEKALDAVYESLCDEKRDAGWEEFGSPGEARKRRMIDRK